MAAVARGMKMMTDDPAWALAQHVCRTSYADLPGSAIESARRDILDTFGCMLGGSGSPAIGELFAVVSRWGGLAESRVLLRGVSLPSPQAALLNASMSARLASYCGGSASATSRRARAILGKTRPSLKSSKKLRRACGRDHGDARSQDTGRNLVSGRDAPGPEEPTYPALGTAQGRERSPTYAPNRPICSVRSAPNAALGRR